MISVVLIEMSSWNKWNSTDIELRRFTMPCEDFIIADTSDISCGEVILHVCARTAVAWEEEKREEQEEEKEQESI